MRVLKRLCLLSLAGAGLTLASCSSTGFAGAMFMSPDQDGKRTQTEFFADPVETPGIYAVIPIVSGRNDETLNVSIHVKSIYGEDVSGAFPNILVASLAPGVQTQISNIVVQFPDPPPLTVPDPTDPLNSIEQPQNRGVGRFQFIAQMNGDVETVNFNINPPKLQPLPDPNAGTPQQEPAPGQCTATGNPASIERCPVPLEPHSVVCCTAFGACGTGVEGTGLCY